MSGSEAGDEGSMGESRYNGHERNEEVDGEPSLPGLAGVLDQLERAAEIVTGRLSTSLGGSRGRVYVENEEEPEDEGGNGISEQSDDGGRNVESWQKRQAHGRATSVTRARRRPSSSNRGGT
jgi:hypothetical protein